MLFTIDLFGQARAKKLTRGRRCCGIGTSRKASAQRLAEIPALSAAARFHTCRRSPYGRPRGPCARRLRVRATLVRETARSVRGRRANRSVKGERLEGVRFISSVWNMGPWVALGTIVPSLRPPSGLGLSARMGVLRILPACYRAWVFGPRGRCRSCGHRWTPCRHRLRRNVSHGEHCRPLRGCPVYQEICTSR